MILNIVIYCIFTAKNLEFVVIYYIFAKSFSNKVLKRPQSEGVRI